MRVLAKFVRGACLCDSGADDGEAAVDGSVRVRETTEGHRATAGVSGAAARRRALADNKQQPASACGKAACDDDDDDDEGDQRRPQVERQHCEKPLSCISSAAREALSPFLTPTSCATSEGVRAPCGGGGAAQPGHSTSLLDTLLLYTTAGAGCSPGEGSAQAWAKWSSAAGSSSTPPLRAQAEWGHVARRGAVGIEMHQLMRDLEIYQLVGKGASPGGVLLGTWKGAVVACKLLVSQLLVLLFPPPPRMSSGVRTTDPHAQSGMQPLSHPVDGTQRSIH